MNHQPDAALAQLTFAQRVSLVNERALALGTLEHADADQFLQRAVRGHERDGHLLGKFLRRRHLLAGLEHAVVDRRLQRVAHGRVERSPAFGHDRHEPLMNGLAPRCLSSAGGFHGSGA